jgi:hypothetical protein
MGKAAISGQLKLGRCAAAKRQKKPPKREMGG